MEVEERAAAALYRLPAKKGREVYAAILSLAVEPRPRRALHIASGEGYGLRIDDSWVLYEVDDERRVVRVYKIGGLGKP